MPRPPKPLPPDAVLYRVLEMLIVEQLDVSTIALHINKEFPGAELSRESVYRLLPRAMELGFLRLVPPFEHTLARKVEAAFACAPGTVRVVDVRRRQSNIAVSRAAAILAKELVDGLWHAPARMAAANRPPRVARAKDLPKAGAADGEAGKEELEDLIGVALGPGRATRDFAEEFGRLLGEDPVPPELRLIAMSACAPAKNPQHSPISFFNMIPAAAVKESIGLYAETFVEAHRMTKIRDVTGVSEAFRAKEEGQIHLVVTSMGDREDPHSLYNLFYEDEEGRLPKVVRREGIADVQYRPYSKSRFLREDENEFRPVTLFELEELVRLAREKDRYVILIARQCAICESKRTRAKPLFPLLANRHMRVFSHLVMDSPTAQEVLAMAEAAAAAATTKGSPGLPK
jgi:hypothetical protein